MYKVIYNNKVIDVIASPTFAATAVISSCAADIVPFSATMNGDSLIL